MPLHTLDLPIPAWVTVAYERDQAFLALTLPCGCQAKMGVPNNRSYFKVKGRGEGNCGRHRNVPPRGIDTWCDADMYFERRQPAPTEPVADEEDDESY